MKKEILNFKKNHSLHGISFQSIKPIDAYQVLQENPLALLIDVRTKYELDNIGKPKIANSQYHCVEWQRYPDGKLNEQFIEQLKTVSDIDTPLLILCRSAVRSKAAASAAIAAGFKNIYDIEEGFEGRANEWGEYQTINGWCFHQLPVETDN